MPKKELLKLKFNLGPGKNATKIWVQIDTYGKNPPKF